MIWKFKIVFLRAILPVACPFSIVGILLAEIAKGIQLVEGNIAHPHINKTLTFNLAFRCIKTVFPVAAWLPQQFRFFCSNVPRKCQPECLYCPHVSGGDGVLSRFMWRKVSYVKNIFIFRAMFERWQAGRVTYSRCFFFVSRNK